jgi:hypothetical protein
VVFSPLPVVSISFTHIQRHRLRLPTQRLLFGPTADSRTPPLRRRAPRLAPTRPILPKSNCGRRISRVSKKPLKRRSSSNVRVGPIPCRSPGMPRPVGAMVIAGPRGGSAIGRMNGITRQAPVSLNAMPAGIGWAMEREYAIGAAGGVRLRRPRSNGSAQRLAGSHPSKVVGA